MELKTPYYGSGGLVRPCGIASILEQAILNLKHRYTLGFSSAKSEENGKYHRLDIKLDPHSPCTGCKVEARAGYYAGFPSLSKGEDSAAISTQPYACTETIDNAFGQIRRVRDNSWEVSAISFEIVRAAPYSANGKPVIDVNLQIDLKGVEFRTQGGKHRGGLVIAVFSWYFQGTRDKSITGTPDEVWKTMDLNLEDLEPYMQTGVSCSISVPYRQNGHRLKIVVYDTASQRMGSKSITL